MITSQSVCHSPEHEQALSRLTRLAKAVTSTSDDMISVRAGYVTEVVRRAELQLRELAKHRGHTNRTYADEILAVDTASFMFVLDTYGMAGQALVSDAEQLKAQIDHAYASAA